MMIPRYFINLLINRPALLLVSIAGYTVKFVSVINGEYSEVMLEDYYRQPGI